MSHLIHTACFSTGQSPLDIWKLCLSSDLIPQRLHRNYVIIETTLTFPPLQMPTSPAFCPNVPFCTLLLVLLGRQPDWAESGLNFRQQSNRGPRRDATWIQDHATAHISFRPISTLTPGPLLWRGEQSRDWSKNLDRLIWRSKEGAWGHWVFLCGTNLPVPLTFFFMVWEMV